MMYMTVEVGVGELRRHLSSYLDRAARGERVVVTDRNRPIAQLTPMPVHSSGLDQLIAEGRVDPPARRGVLPDPLPADEHEENALSEAVVGLRDDEDR